MFFKHKKKCLKEKQIQFYFYFFFLIESEKRKQKENFCGSEQDILVKMKSKIV